MLPARAHSNRGVEPAAEREHDAEKRFTNRAMPRLQPRPKKI
jgi:hypothetical protein